MRRTPLRRMSRKREGERFQRLSIVGETMARARYQCEARDLVPEVECQGGLDPDEIVPRGVYPGGHLDIENTQALCRAHHRWKTDHDEMAHERGLRLWSWERGDRSPRDLAATLQAIWRGR